MKVTSLISVLFAIALLATAVDAADLTGTWQGTFTCKGLDKAGTPTIQAAPGVSVLAITQSGASLSMRLDGALYTGTAIDQAGREDRAGVAVVEGCENDGDPSAFNEMTHLRYKLRTAPDSLRATAVRVTDGPAACTGTWRRVDAADPAVPECPIFYSCVCSGVLGCGLMGDGAAGDNGELVTNVTDAELTADYDNGNANGWICVAQ
jgi:hypothetical protein